VEGAFGRVVDPFVDKVLVIGSFIFLCREELHVPRLQSSPKRQIRWCSTITGVVRGWWW